MKSLIFLLCIALVLPACRQERLTVQGVTGLTGSIVLLAEIPGDSGRIRLDSTLITEGSWELRTSGLKLPARVWLECEGRAYCSFIAAAGEKIEISGDIPDSLVIEGGRLEREFGMVKQVLSERYLIPMERIRDDIEFIRRKSVRTKSDEEALVALERNLNRYREYRIRYLEKLIRANPANELSLFILKEELEDTALKEELFGLLRIGNKESNVFQLLVSSLP